MIGSYQEAASPKVMPPVPNGVTRPMSSRSYATKERCHCATIRLKNASGCWSCSSMAPKRRKKCHTRRRRVAWRWGGPASARGWWPSWVLGIPPSWPMSIGSRICAAWSWVARRCCRNPWWNSYSILPSRGSHKPPMLSVARATLRLSRNHPNYKSTSTK
jgi:hypothetical protein